MKTEHNPPAHACPADVVGWIPWYPDGLEDAQRGAVEAHAADCRECRDEIEMLQGGAVPDQAPEPERIYAQVLARIEASRTTSEAVADDERPVATVSQLPIREARTEHAPPRARRWTSLNRTQRGLALAAGLLAALALGSLAGSSGPGAEPVYESASAEPDVAAASPARLDVVFREDASAAEINRTLRALGARITSGPSPGGVYRLQLSADADLGAATTLLTEDRDGVATFAGKPLRP